MRFSPTEGCSPSNKPSRKALHVISGNPYAKSNWILLRVRLWLPNFPARARKPIWERRQRLGIGLSALSKAIL
jgi:hypothetical protein